MARDPVKIGSSRLLLCEGKSTLLIIGPLGRKYEIQGFQPFDFGSKDNFGNFLRDVTLLPGFVDQVHTLAIVRDAEKDVGGAFMSVCDALRALKLPTPTVPGDIVSDGVRVGVFILPDNTESGMIE